MGRLMRTLRFILSAFWHGYAYIDLDGCLLKRFRCPGGVDAMHALDWWRANLQPTPIVYQRLVLLYILRLLGVKLAIWTNRQPYHEKVTREALGRHMWLFSFQFYCAGQKHKGPRLGGPVMDDQEKYLKCGTGFNLLVEQL